MKHLLISREFPPASYPPGGIGTYVTNIARLLVERGEEVHIIGQRWSGAPLKREVLYGGRLVVHRIGINDLPQRDEATERLIRERDGLKKTTTFNKQWFGWLGAFRIEELIDEEGIDVIEGQEWEAPLYHFLLRRMLGRGPVTSPPCIVHLHSPTEWICRFNGPMVLPREYPMMKRMETFCIRAADALLCPSNYFAHQAEGHYNLAPGSVKVIHLPKGTTEPIARDLQTWSNGSICFIGRLEPRKGIIEWVQAAMNVAQKQSDAHFDFVGADVRNLRDSLIARLPPALRPRFRFHGSKSRTEVREFLSRAKAVVVPSRWENFPNVCIEAMSSGLPVIATRTGGMVEMIEDERTGWLAPDLHVAGMVDGLADALRRCLAASPEKRARMGEMASAAVASLCNNERIVDEHIAFRTDVQRRGAHRSLTLVALSHFGTDDLVRATQFTGSAVVVVSAKTCADAEPLLRSIAGQTMRAAAVALVCASPVSERESARINELAAQDVVTLFCPASMGTEAWNAGYAAIRERIGSGFLLFLDSDDLLQPDCLALMKQILAHRPEVGLVTGWIGREGRRIDAPLCPELSHQLIRIEVGSVLAFRTEALGNATPFRGLPRAYDLWQLTVAVLAKGWIGVTYPSLVAERRGTPAKILGPEVTALRAIRAELLQAAAGRISPKVLDLLDDYVPLSLTENERRGQSAVAQIMSILKAGARRRISQAKKGLLPSRRPTQNA